MNMARHMFTIDSMPCLWYILSLGKINTKHKGKSFAPLNTFTLIFFHGWIFSMQFTEGPSIKLTELMEVIHLVICNFVEPSSIYGILPALWSTWSHWVQAKCLRPMRLYANKSTHSYIHTCIHPVAIKNIHFDKRIPSTVIKAGWMAKLKQAKKITILIISHISQIRWKII